jgi:tetratricopeptide (TPR) repeat protein
MDDISYLFAVEAEQFLMAGMPEEAIELCYRGLEIFPGYAAAVSVLAQAHKALGKKDIAKQLIENAKENIPATSVNYILDSLDNSNIIYNTNPQPQVIEIKELTDNIESYSDAINIENSELSEPDEEIEDFESIDEDFETDEPDIIEPDEEIEDFDSIDEDFDYDEPDIIEPENVENIQEEIDIENDELIDYNDESYSFENEISLENQSEIIEDVNNIKVADVQNEEVKTNLPLSKNKTSFSSNIKVIPGLEKFHFNKAKMIFGGSKIPDIDKYQKIAKQQSNFISIMNSLEKAVPIKSELTIKKENRNAPVMITDTIAGILYQQGAFMEAKKAYSELSDKYPNKSDFYKAKINEIELKLNG